MNYLEELKFRNSCNSMVSLKQKINQIRNISVSKYLFIRICFGLLFSFVICKCFFKKYEILPFI
ncbi:hypothetical protein C3B47_13310 [Flavobacterium columnare]|nr:hypothetical protein [Flavobacterium columnare]PTD13964.1 hypothetical protein C6N29_05685 [Flavobacterium columnare]